MDRVGAALTETTARTRLYVGTHKPAAMSESTEIFRLEGDPAESTVLLPRRYQGYRLARITASCDEGDNAIHVQALSALDGKRRLHATMSLPGGFTHVFPFEHPAPMLYLEATRECPAPVEIHVEYEPITERQATESMLFDPEDRYEIPED